MPGELTSYTLVHENRKFRNSGGVSEGNRSQGFRPAFHDMDTGETFLSCFANGMPAPFHLLDGLPASVVVERDATGRAVAAKASVISGFVRNGRFFTRDEATAHVAARN